jgi:hypothetical protein
MIREPLRLPIAVNRTCLRFAPTCSASPFTRWFEFVVEITRFIGRTEQTSRASRYGLGEIQRMDASKLTNGSRDEVLAKRSAPASKSVQASAVRSEPKKVVKKSTGKKAKTERSPVKAIRKSKSEKLVCRYCGSDDLTPSFIKRRDRRCRKCFSKRYGSAAQTRKTKVKK